jgi:hypothetical protein
MCVTVPVLDTVAALANFFLIRNRNRRKMMRLRMNELIFSTYSNNSKCILWKLNLFGLSYPAL